jgi:hypothetical protein
LLLTFLEGQFRCLTAFVDLDQSACPDFISLPHSQHFPLNFMVISSQSLGLVNFTQLHLLLKDIKYILYPDTLLLLLGYNKSILYSRC